MTGPAASSPRRTSLRFALVLPLFGLSLLLSLVVAFAASVWTYRSVDERLLVEAQRTARVIARVANLGLSPAELRAVLAEFGASRDIRNIVLAAGEPPTVIAALRGEWRNLPVSAIPEPDVVAGLLGTGPAKHKRAIPTPSNSRHIQATARFSLPAESGPPRPARVLVEINEAEERTIIKWRLMRALTVTFGVALGATTLGLVLINRRVIRPLAAIRAMVDARQAGGEAGPVEIDSHDEIAELADALNRSTDEIDELNRQRTEREQRLRHELDEHKRTEAALRRSEERYRAVVENQTDLIVRYRPDGVVTFVNEAFCRVFGATAEQLVGRRWQPLSHSDDLALVEAKLAEISRDTPTQIIENRIVTPGGVRWINFVNHGLFDSEGHLAEVQVVGRDVTERRQMEDRLRLSEQRLLEAQTVGHIGSWYVDFEAQTVEWSEETYRIFGLDPREPVSMVRIEPLLHQDDKETMARQWKRALKNAATYEVEHRIVRPDGIRWVHQHARFDVDERGITRRAIGTIQDVTETRELQDRALNSERQFRLITETIDEVFWMADAQINRMLYVSPAYERVWGRSCASLYEDPRSFLNAIHPDDRAHVLANMERKRDGLPFTYEGRIIRPDGTVRWIVDRGFPVQHQTGVAAIYVGAAQDITEHKVVERQLRESQTLETIGLLTGSLAHDFNNLLGLVVGNLDLIGEALPVDERLQRQHRAAVDAALRAAAVTRALLSVAQRQPLEIRTYEINTLIEELIPLLGPSLGKAIRLDVELSSAPLPARLDKTGLTNVVLNLVLNARDAMTGSEREKRLELRTLGEAVAAGAVAKLAPGSYAVLEVADTGHGMSTTVRAQAFDPFFTTKPRGVGTGLGLAMVYGYATQLGGTATIESAEGVGTTVRVYLPLEATETEERVQQLAESAAGLGARAGRPRPGRVLVVDDEPEICLVACEWLESAGYTTASANSALEALECLATDHFDVLFTDVVMPGSIDGVALARRAKDLHPGLQIILTSGYAQVLLDEVERPGKLLAKPYRRDDLLSAIEHTSMSASGDEADEGGA